MKKILLLALVFTLAACGKAGPRTAKTSDSPAPKPVPQPQPITEDQMGMINLVLADSSDLARSFLLSVRKEPQPAESPRMVDAGAIVAQSCQALQDGNVAKVGGATCPVVATRRYDEVCNAEHSKCVMSKRMEFTTNIASTIGQNFDVNAWSMQLSGEMVESKRTKEGVSFRGETITKKGYLNSQKYGRVEITEDIKEEYLCISEDSCKRQMRYQSIKYLKFGTFTLKLECWVQKDGALGTQLGCEANGKTIPQGQIAVLMREFLQDK